MGVEKYKISDEGLTMHLNILEVDVDSIKRAVELGARYGLLITDSIHLSTMDKNRIGNIATNDGDFDRVDFIQAWKP